VEIGSLKTNPIDISIGCAEATNKVYPKREAEEKRSNHVQQYEDFSILHQ